MTFPSALLGSYIGHAATCVDAGLISGAIVQHPLDPARYTLIAVVGAAVFLSATVLNEFVLPSGALRRASSPLPSPCRSASHAQRRTAALRGLSRTRRDVDPLRTRPVLRGVRAPARARPLAQHHGSGGSFWFFSPRPSPSSACAASPTGWPPSRAAAGTATAKNAPAKHKRRTRRIRATTRTRAGRHRPPRNLGGTATPTESEEAGHADGGHSH